MPLSFPKAASLHPRAESDGHDHPDTCSAPARPAQQLQCSGWGKGKKRNKEEEEKTKKEKRKTGKKEKKGERNKILKKKKVPQGRQFIMQSLLDGSILGRTLRGHHWTLCFQPLRWAFFLFSSPALMRKMLKWIFASTEPGQRRFTSSGA